MSSSPLARPVAILGPGLIGGSLGLALRKRQPATPLRIWGRREESLDAPRRSGLAPLCTTDVLEAIADAGTIVLCTPVECMADLAAQIAPHLAPDAVVTDAGSVKGPVVTACEDHLGGRFVSAHPIAGSDRNGFDAADADLYDGATCVITPTPRTDPQALTRAHELWASVGCHVLELSPRAHDAALARTSHLPHVVASLVAASVDRHVRDWPRLAGGGFRDTTRIALGHPDLWTGILLANRTEIATAVAELTEILQNVQAALESGDAATLHQWLAAGRSARQKFDVLL